MTEREGPQISRRRFLEKIMTGAALATTSANGLLLVRNTNFDGIKNTILSPEKSPRIKGLEDILFRVYNVRVNFGPAISSSENEYNKEKNPTEQMYYEALVQIEKSLSVYPCTLIQNANISFRIVETPQLTKPNFTSGSIGNITFEIKLYAFAEGSSPYPYNIQDTVHHELYHYFDYKSGKPAYLKDPEYSKNKEWATLHNKYCGCSPYNKVGWDITQDNLHMFFARDYASSHPSEDRAVMAEMIMDPEKHKKLLELFNTRSSHPVLKEKYLKILNDYRTWSEGRMDESFWKEFLSSK
jgi:hypothetical protein